MNTVSGDIEMPLTEHLKELRQRMMMIVISLIIITSIVFLYSDKILKLLWSQVIPPSIFMTIYSPIELILAKLTISFLLALFIGIPLSVYEALMFVGKGLYENEKLFFIKVVPLSFILFILGTSLAYLVAVPLIFKYTIFYSTDIASPQVSVLKTIYTITSLVIGFGIIFQFPLFLIFAMKMNLIKREYLKQKRKIIYGLLFAFAFFVSPDPSAISEFMVAFILVALFEFSLLIAKFF